jgi:hypothetical protein
MHFPAEIRPHRFQRFLYHLLLRRKTPTRDLFRGIEALEEPCIPSKYFSEGWWTSPSKENTETAQDLMLEWRGWVCCSVALRLLEEEQDDKTEEEVVDEAEDEFSAGDHSDDGRYTAVCDSDTVHAGSDDDMQ